MHDILSEIWATARRNKLRTSLTGFAVAWGIFLLIFLLGAGNGLINAFTHNSGRFVDNSMTVFGGVTSKAYKGYKEGRSIELKTEDLTTTEQHFSENIEELGAELSTGMQSVSLGENYFSGNITGVYPNHAEVHKYVMLHGRFLNNNDIAEHHKVIVMDDSQAKELLPHEPSALVGRYVNVGGIAFQVVGIYKASEMRQSTNVFAPFSTVRLLYKQGDKAGDIVFTFKNLPTKEANEAFEHRYKATLAKNHHADPEDDDAIWIWNHFTQSLQTQSASSIIRTALWVIGIFSLLSGIVGVSNIMLITVKERTREFGIRKAIGASPFSILRLILIESVIITTFFGYIGMVLGMAANQYMNATIGNQTIDTGLFKAAMFVNPTVGFDVCVGATIVMIVSGTLAGLLPARKAAHIRPIEALRAE